MEVLEANQMHVFPRMFFIDVDECANTPCKNRAACVNLPGSYHCNCKSGFTGSNCETGNSFPKKLHWIKIFSILLKVPAVVTKKNVP